MKFALWVLAFAFALLADLVSYWAARVILPQMGLDVPAFGAWAWAWLLILVSTILGGLAFVTIKAAAETK